MEALVGYTGFVGSNIIKSHKFDCLYNSKNIEDAFDSQFDLLVYSGVKAEKFLANKFPKEDMEHIKGAIDNIKKINPKKLVLISTTDVYDKTYDVNELTSIGTNNFNTYGLDRFFLEQWVEQNIKDYMIVRLPALYGINLKKNFIFDLINLIPAMLNENKFNELNVNNKLSKYYQRQINGFYKLIELDSNEREYLKQYFNNNDFNALNFTDSRAMFQFYNLDYLWQHIELGLKNNIKKLNIVTEPIVASELYKLIKGKEFINEINDNFQRYNINTIYDNIFGGKNGYIFDKAFILSDIEKFIKKRS